MPGAGGRAGGPPLPVPTRYDEGRWFVRPVTAAGDTLELYTDTGGGWSVVVREVLPAGAPRTFAFVLPSSDSAFTVAWSAGDASRAPRPAAADAVPGSGPAPAAV